MEYKVRQLEPYLGNQELENLKEVIDNKWLTEGPFSQKFIEQIKNFTGAKHAVLANNGTLGLFLALMALGVKEGDEVIVPDFTFIASATSIVFTGATPIFVDIEPGSLEIDVDCIERAITTKTKAIMPVHVYGQAADMEPIMNLASKYNLQVIEDAAQGFGVFYKGKHTGTIGDIGVISFFADKTITTGEGAIVLTNDDALFDKLRYLRNQGRLNSGTFTHTHLGMNFRMTDLQCAVGVAQVEKFDEILRIKMSNHSMYKKLLGGIKEIRFVEEKKYSSIVPFRTNIMVDDKEGLMAHLESNGIQTRSFFYPLHKQPCFGHLPNTENSIPVSDNAYDTGVSLPVYCGLKSEQIEYICDTIKAYFQNKKGIRE